MDIYRDLYYKLFARAADAVEELDKALPEEGEPDLLGVYRARAILIVAMQKAEEQFMESEETDG